MTDAVAIISKLPRLGGTKTRLAAAVGPGRALALHRAFLEDELSQLHRPDAWQLYLVHDAPRSPAEVELAAALVRGRARALIPGGRGLSDDLRAGFVRLLAHHDRAVIVSADIPHLSHAIVARALDALERADVVLGPGPDGGYYLVGLRAPHDLFTPIAMGTSGVTEATRALAEQRGLSVAFVDRITDIDEAQDLLAIERAPDTVATRSRAAMAELARGEFALALPTELQVEVTSRCNHRCPTCLRTFTPLGPDADLSLEDFERIIAGLPRLARVAFQLNGEPLLCADLFAMIARARAVGAQTVLNTNGVLLDGRRRQALLESGLDDLRVSFNGAREATVDAMAGAPAYERLVGNVAALAKERGARRAPRISLWMMGTQQNIAELPELVELAARLGADEVYLQRLVLIDRGAATRADTLFGVVDDRVRSAVAEAERLAGRLGVALSASGRKPLLESLTPSADEHPWHACWRPWRTAVVTASHLVLPCCISSFRTPYERLKLGDLSTSDWPTIWNGERYRALRRGLLDGDPISSCRGCTAWWSL